MLFVRHAESEANVIGSLHCRVPGPSITELGQRQAKALVSTLADEDVRVIWASTMTRAQETAAPLAAARGLDVRVHDGLKETDLGVLHDRTDSEAIGQFEDLFAGWVLAGDLKSRADEGESGQEILDRFTAALSEVMDSFPANTDGTVVVVSHGAALRFVLMNLCGIDPTFALRHHLANTDFVATDVVDGALVCRSWAGLTPKLAEHAE